MSLNKAVSCGLVGNELSKQITGSNDSSVSRTAVAIGSGAAAGALTSGAIVIGCRVCASYNPFGGSWWSSCWHY